MNINLRFGMHRDIEVIHGTHSLLDGLVIPAHILAYQPASTAAFVCSWPKHYMIDPMTYWLQCPREDHAGAEGNLRPSVAKWCEQIHPELAKVLLSGPSTVHPDRLPDLEEMCKNLYKFQVEAVDAGHVDPRAKKYLERYNMTVAKKPRCVLPPYFAFANLGDPWYKATLNAANLMSSVVDDEEIAAVIVCAATVLDDDTVGQIAKDFGGFRRCFVWIDGLSQVAANADDIRRVRRLTSLFASTKCHVEALYGGFMMMLMAYNDGMEAITHGILYTQDKKTGRVIGGGGVPERFYIPRFHDFRSLSQANLILKRHPELVGGTPTADKIMGGDPDRIFMFASQPNHLRRHFLEARQAECKSLTSMTLAQQLEELRDTHRKYHSSVRHLPNPDAVLTGGEMKGLDYLLAWARAFGEE